MNNRSIDERFIAKTRPIRKDIQWHTDDLIHNLEIMKGIYPELKIDWELLRLACIYHDLGKMNKKFQECVHRKGKSTGVPHGLLSLGFIDVEFLEDRGYDEEDISILFHSVAYHHERDISLSLDEIYEEIRTLIGIFQDFDYCHLPTRHLNPRFDQMFYKPGKRFYESKDGEYFFNYIMIKGTLNRLDYAASAGIDVEYRNDFLMDSMGRLLETWKLQNSKTEWNSLQKHMLEHQNENVIVIAQTGMGKTEAGLLWLGDHKGFFTLPLKSAINAIYERIIKFIVTTDVEKRVGLLHSDILKVYYERQEEKVKNKAENSDETEMEFENYYTSTKQLSLPLTICTLDQIFDFVYRYKGFEHKLATLSYSKVIIDEIQMYSPDLVAYLIIGLRYITKLGGRFAILTATLPGLITDFLEKEGILFSKPIVFTKDLIRHSVKRIEDIIDTESSIAQIVEAFDGNKILIICNTIKKAKEVYAKVKNSLDDSQKDCIHLLHSGFVRRDRSIKENHIMKTGEKGIQKSEIWVSTQLVEASLDIDFDLLFTELSDLNGLFQRMGRCYRHRVLDREYNCFVFLGGSKKCSGVGKASVIEPEIHNFSKEAITSDGILTEESKIQMIENTYSSEKLSGTSYYNKIVDTIQQVKDMPSYGYTKKEVNEMFRDIDQTAVIPLNIYKENETNIRIDIEILKDKNMSLEEKVRAREKLRDLMVPVQTRLANETAWDKIEINKAFKLIIVDAEYNFETGISFEKTKNEEFRNVENRMF